MESYLLSLLGEKNHLRSRFCVTKRELHDRVLDCGFHSYIKQETCMNFVPFLKEKAEFTEHNDPSSMELEVRADLYVFSPQEIKRIAQDVDAAIEMQKHEVRRLQKRLSDSAPKSAVTAAQYLADLRLGGLNEAQKHIERLEKELLHLQKLSVDIAMFTPPPIIMVEGSSYQKGKEDGIALSEKSWFKSSTRIKELEGQVKNLEEYTAKGVAFRDGLQSRIKELEYSLKGIRQETVEALSSSSSSSDNAVLTHS